ncbi:MAG: hypothetical protein IJJ99_04525 [Oscillospiraceae bacterium]|nr:hypothetical protein [Oscillospiraceae bacterium]
MKKLISLLLVLALCLSAVCVLTACSEETSEEPSTGLAETAGASTEATSVLTEATDAPTDATDDPSEFPFVPALGGWEVNGKDVEADMPEEARDAFDKAMAELDGADYAPLAYLGSQVVAGMNYAYLCRSTLVIAEPLSKLTLVTVYRDLEGNASILGISDIEIADYTEDAALPFDAEPLDGGWAPCADYPAKLSEDEQAAFDAATAELLGVDYTPLALMGTQVVAGTNLAFLCCAATVTAEPASTLCVLIVYADLEGNYTLTSIAPFSIG